MEERIIISSLTGEDKKRLIRLVYIYFCLDWILYPHANLTIYLNSSYITRLEREEKIIDSNIIRVNFYLKKEKKSKSKGLSSPKFNNLQIRKSNLINEVSSKNHEINLLEFSRLTTVLRFKVNNQERSRLIKDIQFYSLPTN